MATPYKTKNYSDCYLYGKGEYEKNIYKFFIESEIINKNSELFDDIRFSVKRLSPSISIDNTLESPNVIFLKHSNPMPRAFKVFTAKDLKSGDNQLKVFIDISDLIVTKNGTISIHASNMDKLISFLASALLMRIYYSYPEKIFNNSRLMDSATRCFAKLFTYVIDFLRISGADRMREKCLYLSSLYFQSTMFGRDYSQSFETKAKQVSSISSKDIEVIDIRLPKDTFNDISTFVSSVAGIINAPGLKLDNFIDTWLRLFGSGTQFATEYFPAMSSLITNTYLGSYLNNQKTIEKICGSSIVDYTKILFSIGNELK